MIYLDHAATTPMRPGVKEAMEPYLTDVFGNPSGVHEVSRRAKNALEESRERIAALIGARPMEIVFTSGGTESDNLAIKGTGRAVVTVATEHDAVLEPAHHLERMGTRVAVVGVDRNGEVGDVDSLLDGEPTLVSVMWANGETGVVTDIPALGTTLKEAHPDVLFHTDAVQAFSSEDVQVDGVDLMTLAAHKLGGPKGVGVLFVREGIALEPVLHGGGHELGRRSGTHNVAGAVGMATAMELAVTDRDRFRDVVAGIRDDFEKRLLAAVPEAEVNGGARTSQHLNIRLPGIRNQTLLLRLDQAGVAASAASACQSGAAKVSHVLESMGLTPDQARECIRFSFGWNTTVDEATDASSIVTELVEVLR